ncbi:unnamed protein product [Heterobilharzia americana]|nr:unnamed protein product [Heterobilharzia americana]
MAISPSTSQASNSAAISVDLTEAFQLVVLSKSFFNWKEVEDAVNELQKVTHTHYVHVKSKEAGDSCFKYTFVVFKCTFGVNRKPQGIGLIKKPSKFRDCPSMFRFALNDNKYTVRSYRMIHNHPCTQSFMTCDAWSRRLTEEEKEYLKQFYSSHPQQMK